MKDFIIHNWKEQLQSAIPDEKAGITIACLTDDSYFSMYITELPIDKKVNAHYHTEGIETYQILSGRGVIHLGNHCKDGTIKNIASHPVVEGDFFNQEDNIT